MTKILFTCLIFSFILTHSIAIPLRIEVEKIPASPKNRNEFKEGDSFGADAIFAKKIKYFGKEQLTHKTIENFTDQNLRYTYQENWSARNNHLILVGDSNTFGWGLNDDETLGHFLAKELKHFRIYNLGRSGTGPNDFLYKLKEKDILKKIPKKNGVMILQFFPYYYPRVRGTGAYFHWQGPTDAPWYELNENSEIVHRGRFNERWTTPLYIHLYKYFLINFKKDFPPIDKGTIELSIRIIKEIKSTYLKTFPKGKFLVLLMPDFSKPNSLTLEKSLLKELKLDFIQINSIGNFNKKINEFFQKDDHFTSLANQTIAREIAKEIPKESY